jgi:hypothetical protein
MNFFEWIRNGVRQAVLLGVTDAVDEIGTPAEGDDMNQRLLEVIRTGGPKTSGKRVSGGSKRKKLGRSLQEIQTG